MNLSSQRGNSKLLVIAGLLGLVIVTYIVFGPRWYQNYAPVQPIPFSHKRHAGDFKIPCLYCHGSAEYAAYAEVPGMSTCMNCHKAVKVDSPFIKQVAKAYEDKKPIEWVKVHVLPDFVRFRHNRHIAAGVPCATCHGPIEKMDKVYQYAPLTMGWCVECHRNDNFLTDARKEFSENKKRLLNEPEKPWWFKALSHPDPSNADVSCSTCHY